MAAIREVLDGLDVDDALGGESGQLVRQSLAEHGRRAEVLGDAARAVAQAVQARRANVANVGLTDRARIDDPIVALRSHVFAALISEELLQYLSH